jgi:hypothetical protein
MANRDVARLRRASGVSLMACSSKGIAARQLGFWLGVQYRTA